MTMTRHARYIRLQKMTLDEGLAYISRQHYRKIGGFWIEKASKPSNTRLHMFKSGQTRCVSCGLEGSLFHIERHKNDKVMPFSINLYGVRDGEEIMMTWDHILPKSMGGSNHLSNAQCMCEKCNQKKGTDISLADLIKLSKIQNFLEIHKALPMEPVFTFEGEYDVA